MTEPADLEVRQRALAPDASFIVQAPAGSGKTELLTQRYLRLLAIVEAPEEIIAITFTRKAAAEMRMRILGALDQAAGPEPAADPDRARWRLARAALDRSDAQGWALDRNPGRLRVLTLDGLDRRLAARLPVLAGGRAGLGLAERPELLYREAARRTFTEGGPEAGDAALTERVLAHLDNRMPLAVDLVAALLARRDQWSRHLRADGGDGADERTALESGLVALARWAIARFTAALGPDGTATLARAAAASAEAQGEGSRAQACAGLSGPPAPDALEAWRGIAALILTSAGELRAKLTARDGVAAGTSEYTASNAVMAAIAGDEEVRRAALMLRAAPGMRYDDASWPVLAALPRVLRLAVAQLELLFRERGQTDYAGVSQAAHDALADEGAPTELLLALDHRIRHLLVDEFQDTSARQVALVRLLTEGWAPEDGRTLFCVGDPMQSIYRFREADVGLFLSVWADGLAGLPMERLRLSANFRSAAGIVDWVNATFRRTLPTSDDPVLGKVSYTPSVAARAPDALPPVSWVAAPGVGAGGLARRVADAVAGIRAAHPEDSVAVLVQKRSQLTALLPALRARDLRYRGVDLLRLEQRPAVQDLMSLYRAITHPGDRVAWLALLHGPLCGLDLATLETLLGRDAQPVPASLRQPERLARLEPDARTRLDRLLAALDEAQALREIAPARRWLEAAWLAAGGAAAQLDAAALEDAQVLLDLIAALDAGGEVSSTDELETALAALYAPPDPEGDELLQVLTIHAAKGLEFDHVVLMLPQGAARSDDAPLLHHAELRGVRADGDDPVVLAPIGAYGDDADPVHACLSLLGRERSYYEAGRLLYVATTRARRQLLLAGTTAIRDTADGPTLQRPNSGSLLRLLWDEAEGDFEAAMAARGASDQEAASTLRSLRRLRADWRRPPPPEPAFAVAALPPRSAGNVEFSWAGETARHVGTLVHRLLQRVAEQGPEAWGADRIRAGRDPVKVQLATLGVPTDALDAAAQRVEDAVAAALACEHGRWVLSAHEDARCEFAISGVLDGAVVEAVVDRCFLDADGVRWIIDYKTSSHEGGDLEAFLVEEGARYAGQLDRYAQLFAALESRPVRTALYYPTLGRLIEVDRLGGTG